MWLLALLASFDHGNQFLPSLKCLIKETNKWHLRHITAQHAAFTSHWWNSLRVDFKIIDLRAFSQPTSGMWYPDFGQPTKPKHADAVAFNFTVSLPPYAEFVRLAKDDPYTALMLLGSTWSTWSTLSQGLQWTRNNRWPNPRCPQWSLKPSMDAVTSTLVKVKHLGPPWQVCTLGPPAKMAWKWEAARPTSGVSGCSFRLSSKCAHGLRGQLCVDTALDQSLMLHNSRYDTGRPRKFQTPGCFSILWALSMSLTRKCGFKDHKSAWRCMENHSNLGIHQGDPSNAVQWAPSRAVWTLQPQWTSTLPCHGTKPSWNTIATCSGLKPSNGIHRAGMIRLTRQPGWSNQKANQTPNNACHMFCYGRGLEVSLDRTPLSGGRCLRIGGRIFANLIHDVDNLIRPIFGSGICLRLPNVDLKHLGARPATDCGQNALESPIGSGADRSDWTLQMYIYVAFWDQQTFQLRRSISFSADKPIERRDVHCQVSDQRWRYGRHSSPRKTPFWTAQVGELVKRSPARAFVPSRLAFKTFVATCRFSRTEKASLFLVSSWILLDSSAVLYPLNLRRATDSAISKKPSAATFRAFASHPAPTHGGCSLSVKVLANVRCTLLLNRIAAKIAVAQFSQCLIFSHLNAEFCWLLAVIAFFFLSESSASAWMTYGSPRSKQVIVLFVLLPFTGE